MANQRKRVSTKEAQEAIIRALASGSTKTLEELCADQGRKYGTYLYWRKTDKEFAGRADRARERAGETVDSDSIPDFPQFCEEYLDLKFSEHVHRAYDVISGKTPSNMTVGMKLEWSGELSHNRRIIMNFPPDHGKSTIFTIAYTVWNIYKNPSFRVIILCNTNELAKDFLFSIQQYLLNPVFTKLREKDPPGGWRDDELPWTANYMYVRGRDVGAAANPDPTVQALGMGQQLYGRRCDLLIADDIETTVNVGGYKTHAKILTREANSRLRPSTVGLVDEGEEVDPGGLLLVLGTRVAPVDVYSYLREAGRDQNELGYTYFAQPAILQNEFLPKEQWVTLWPERQGPGQVAQHRAGYVDQREFQLIYQQNDISDDAPFPAGCVDSAVNPQRYAGILSGTVPGNRKMGMDGLHIVGGVDPATTGGTAMVVVGADPLTMRRYVLDVFYERNVHAERFIQQIKTMTERYGVKEWRIERNAFQRFLTQLDALTSYMNARGVIITEHMTTGHTKWDEDWGVSTLIPLFKSCAQESSEGLYVARPRTPWVEGTHLIELPKPKQHPGILALIQQLKVWDVNIAKHTATDTVMALWFAEIAAREYLLGRRATGSGKKGRFVNKHMEGRRRTLDVEQSLMDVLMKDHAYGYM